MLDLRHLTIRSETRVLVEDFSLSLPRSGLTALIGPSGCGKSSVLKWLAGIAPEGLTASGDLRLNGEAAARPDRRISYQPQSDALLPWLKIAENAALALELSGRSRRQALAEVLPLFPAFGLSGCESLYPSELSGGMRQRAAFLRSIVRGAPILLLDEPFSALDAVTRLRMQDWLIRALAQRDVTTLLVTHDLTEATALADRILVMATRPGRIIQDIPVSLPRHQRSEARLADLREQLKTLLLEKDPE